MLIGYRDYVKDATITHTSGVAWEAGSPLSNAQDRRLAVVARNVSVMGSSAKDRFTLPTPKDIGIIAFLAHTFTEAVVTAVSVTFRDIAETFIVQYIFFNGTPPGVGPGEIQKPLWFPAEDSQFPRNLIQVLDEVVSDVSMIDTQIFYQGDSSADGQDVDIGRFWAGPAWRTSEDSVSREDFDPRIVDPGTINKSLGGQNYADVRQKYRQHTMRLPWLSEAEAIGTEDGSTQNLQDISFEVGKTDPIIAIPSLDNNQVIHKLGMYGTFAEPPSPRLIPESAERHYESTFDVIEEL